MSLKSIFNKWVWGWTHHYSWPYVEFKLNQGWKARRSAWPSSDSWIEAVHPHQQFGDLSNLQECVVCNNKGASLLPYQVSNEDINTHDWTVWK